MALLDSRLRRSKRRCLAVAKLLKTGIGLRHRLSALRRKRCKAPVEAPIEAPFEAPFEAAVEAPFEAAVEAPIEAPFEAAVEAPIEAHIKAPKEAPIEAPKEAAVEASKEAAVDAPIEAPIEAPNEPDFEAPIQAPVEASVKSPAERPEPYLRPHPLHTEPRSVLLTIPGEIRNEIYRYLLPQSTRPDGTNGLYCSCTQLREEFGSMVISHARSSIEAATMRSIALRQSFIGPHRTRTSPYIKFPMIAKFSELRNLGVSLSLNYCDYTSLSPAQRSTHFVRTPTLSEGFAALEGLLSLHLKYITITVSCSIRREETRDLWAVRVRHSLLYTCVHAFYTLARRHAINAGHVIFDLSGSYVGPLLMTDHRPYIAFVRRERRPRDGVVMKMPRHELLGHDPNPRILVDELEGDLRPETEARLLERLEDIVRKSRMTVPGVVID